jgi:putative ABC transport system substrate-binding protein
MTGGECQVSGDEWIEAEKKMKMKIRVLALSAILFALSYSASAQQPKKVPRIGYLSVSDAATDSARSEGIRLALRERGYIEGQNIAFEYRYAKGKLDRFPELAAELVRLKVDIIVVAGGNTLIRAAKNATKTIPIVMAGAAPDPVEAGFVDSLARPGGNVTGLALLVTETAGSGWSCSKKPFPNLPASRFSTIRLFRPMYSS